MAREHEVNANQVFQRRYEYRKRTLGVRQPAQAKLMPVTVIAEPNGVTLTGIAPVTSPSGSIYIELPGRAVIRAEAGVGPELVRTVVGTLLR